MTAALEFAELRARAYLALRALAAQTGAMVALVPSSADAGRLAVPGGEPVDQLHTTLLYLGEAVDISTEARAAIVERLRELAPGLGRVAADGFAISMFNPDSDERQPCIVLGLSGADLDEVHTAVAAALNQVDMVLPEQLAPWTPHVTLIYTDDAARVAELTDRTGPVNFDRLRVAFAGETTDIPLTAIDGLRRRAARYLDLPDLHLRYSDDQERDEGGRFAGSGGGGGGSSSSNSGSGGSDTGPKTPQAMHSEATIHRVYNYTDEHTGLSTRVDSIRSNGPGFSTYVSGSILDRDGNIVGGFERDIRPADQATVHHGGLVLHGALGGNELQGQGFATRFNAKTEADYREHGITKITLNADIDVGGYAWAKAGYQFSDHFGRQNVIDRATIFGIRHPGVKADIARVASNPHSSPIDFAMIGHSPGLSTWPGKQIMLGSNWDGYKNL